LPNEAGGETGDLARTFKGGGGGRRTYELKKRKKRFKGKDTNLEHIPKKKKTGN